jgi:hypothetical protein
MLRKHWRDPQFWRWLWRDRASPEVKAGICVVVAVLILGGGWFAAERLAGASAATSAGQVKFVPELEATTVEKMVTVRSNGRVIRKLVPEVRKTVVLETTTSVRTDVVTLAGGVRTVQSSRTVDVPVVTKKVITAAGRTATIVTTKLVPTIETKTSTETRTSTVVQSRTQTQVETQPITVTRTQTTSVTTTRTVTQPVTTTQVVTVTQTTTAPPVTDTVTVTVPFLTVTL